mgnify:CR=1 FL=1
MNVIAVAQLDRLIRKLDKLDSEKITDVLLRQIHLLEQCHTVREWLFMAEPGSIARIAADFHAQVPGKLIATLSGDPLDEFYRATSQRGSKFLSDDKQPCIARVIPGLQDPDPGAIDDVVQNHIHGGYDYSRTDRADDGILAYIEVMNFSVLDEAWREALLPDDREHITPYIYRQNSRLSLGTFNTAHLASVPSNIPASNTP